MKRKLGIVSEALEGLDSLSTLDYIKEAGFECYFTRICDPNEIEKLKARGDTLGLSCEFIHAPFFGINNMWVEGDEYLKIFREMKQAIDSAHAVDIPTVVIHLSSGWCPPEICDTGLSRFDTLVDYAEAKNVILAIENLRKIGNLAYLADRYEKSGNVGFCYDAGHEHCYTKTVCWMDIFRDRTVATHIHDNFGKTDNPDSHDDLHLLPFDGNVDYTRMIHKLDEYGCDIPLMLEVFDSRYPNLSREKFMSEAYLRAKRLSEI